MKTTILSKLIGKKRQKKQEKKRIFNLNDAKVEDHYSMGEVLGKGSFAKVKMGMHYKSSKKVAIKIIEKNNIEVKIESLKTEVKILMNVKHPNIVSLLDVFEDDDKLYLIMELMTGGELFDKICNDYPNGYSEKQAADLTRQIIEAVKYLHGKGIIHRDLKPENLLFSHPDDDSAQIKISDFGLAKIWSGDTLARTACGSPNYVAPEILLNEMRGYTFAVDMWSVGVIVYVLLCGFCPFFDENTPALFRAITAGKYSFPDPYWKSISDEAKDFIRRLLVVNPEQRMTPEQALQHPWISDNKSTEPISDITKNMKTFKASRSQASLCEDDEDEDED
eukprot:Rhum_TRINITY_DN14945_c6_g1::Rhum_TRINITY_DN14945_c6_g1_i1::g.130917::m.130917/K08794/CAMK1; calcium/calmodulin-dependent protein kinase I